MSEIYPWQQDDWKRLQSLRNRTSQGLLFQGLQGIGKLALALHYARSLLCEQPDAEGFACEHCQACHWFEQGSHPDFRFLQPDSLTEEAETGKKPSSQISVDQIRSLADFMAMTAHQGGRRVVIIHPAEAMNANAANALLKNLEEPPKGLLFMLVTHKPQQLLPTLLSRCLAFGLAPPNAAMAERWLAAKGLNHPADALAAAGFSPLLALQNADQRGAAERDKLRQALRQPAMLDVFALAEVLQKTEQVLLVQWLQLWCYDLASFKLTGRLRYHPQDLVAITALVAPLDVMNLVRLQKFLQTAKKEAQHTLNTKLFIESILFTYRQLITPCHS